MELNVCLAVLMVVNIFFCLLKIFSLLIPEVKGAVLCAEYIR